jgi:hypothetical protein
VPRPRRAGVEGVRIAFPGVPFCTI